MEKTILQKQSGVVSRNNFKKKPVAYFSAEFALIDDMPSYAGGLGILAGDYILEAAEQKFPLVGIGLFYQRGQNQTINKSRSGKDFGLRLVRRGFKRLLIRIPIEDRDVFVQVWEWRKRGNSVYFLDTNIPENNAEGRIITEQLYAEDRELRIKQELILGIGGIRLLRALKIKPSVYHLNEGHSAFLMIELLAEKNLTPIVFTNHTLVLEGQEMFALDSLVRNTKKLCAELNIKIEDIIKRGQAQSSDTLFSMTALALNSAKFTNAVSRIHGEKARALWPDYPIIHITNGIFLPRWDKIKSKDIVRSHQKNEEKLLKLIRQIRGDRWQKEALLVGWSRRFVPYKRPLALLDDVAKLKQLAEKFKGQIHIVYSAPLDEDDANKNEFLKRLFELMNGELKDLITFIPHYRIDIAQTIVAGCDIWLNTPIVGREACGTSGMKAALNGTLAVSTNDGWINEVNIDDLGWLVDDQDITPSLLKTLEDQIMPLYKKSFERNSVNEWKQKMKKARELVVTDFSTKRMLREYIEKLYLPVILQQDKKLIAFDVDGTLSPSRGLIDQTMSTLLSKLLLTKKIAIITGGAFADIQKQILDQLPKEANLANLFLLPTNGGRLCIFDGQWKEISVHNLTTEEKNKIVQAIKEVDQSDPELRDNKSFGQEIQDRGSQITYGALGENAPIDLKYAWDPDLKKRISIQQKLKERLPEFEVKIGGKTSIDITPSGMDKAFAIEKITKHLGLNRWNVLFIGDAIYKDGNDYPVQQAGVDTIKVNGPEETKKVIENIIS